ncbi:MULTISPECIES: restriction endonuclease subunit S [Streptomyces]|uniref:restriction endonuclease subunit S n=1 Tax=Streptomyces TaxID=1883 RepID=UPI0036A066BD
MSAEEWEEAPLGSRLLSIETGRSPSLTDTPAAPGHWGVLKVSAINSSGFRPSENKAVDDAALINERFEVRPGDLLFSRANTPELVGAACIAAPSQERLMLSDKTLRLVVDRRLAEPEFVKLSLASPTVRKQIAVAASGSSLSMQNISQERVEALSIRWPDLKEQRHIVEFLEALGEKERSIEAAITKLRVVRRGALMSMMSSLELAELTPGFMRESLKEFVPVVEYGVSVALGREPVGTPVLRMNNLHEGRAVVDDLRYLPRSVPSGLLLRDGDVLFNRTNSIEHVGKSALWRGELPEATFASYLVRLVPNRQKLLPEYLVEWLQHPLIRQRIRAIATVAVQQVNVNPTRLRELEIDVPEDLDFQRKAVGVLSAFDDRIEAQREEQRKLAELKAGLVDDLLQGARRIG